MVCSKRNESDIDISRKGNGIEQVNQVKYLGSTISNSGRSIKVKKKVE